MPTKKKRVGFIPRNDVYDIVNKLSIERNLSNSKIINMLVEEALYKRGLLNLKTGKAFNNFYSSYLNDNYQDARDSFNNEFPHDFKKGFLDNTNSYSKDIEEYTLDREIYSKFLLFLQFQEKMKKSQS